MTQRLSCRETTAPFLHTQTFKQLEQSFALGLTALPWGRQPKNIRKIIQPSRLLQPSSLQALLPSRPPAFLPAFKASSSSLHLQVSSLQPSSLPALQPSNLPPFQPPAFQAFNLPAFKPSGSNLEGWRAAVFELGGPKAGRLEGWKAGMLEGGRLERLEGGPSRLPAFHLSSPRSSLPAFQPSSIPAFQPSSLPAFQPSRSSIPAFQPSTFQPSSLSCKAGKLEGWKTGMLQGCNWRAGRLGLEGWNAGRLEA